VRSVCRVWAECLVLGAVTDPGIRNLNAKKHAIYLRVKPQTLTERRLRCFWIKTNMFILVYIGNTRNVFPAVRALQDSVVTSLGTQNPEPGTRIPQPKTRNSQPRTWYPEPAGLGTRNPEPGTWNPEPGTQETMPNLIAVSIHHKYSEGRSIQPICARCCIYND
jgi:hypothetical protein